MEVGQQTGSQAEGLPSARQGPMHESLSWPMHTFAQLTFLKERVVFKEVHISGYLLS